MIPPQPRQGDIWLARFDPVEGHEQAGTRPALILSNDKYNHLPSGLCIVTPITTRDRGIPFHWRLEPPEGGLTRVSFVLCDQPRAMTVGRLLTRRGFVTAKTLQAVQRLVSMFIEVV